MNWQHHVAAVVIFLAWLELMMLVGRFPIFGLYVQMFTTGKRAVAVRASSAQESKYRLINVSLFLQWR